MTNIALDSDAGIHVFDKRLNLTPCRNGELLLISVSEYKIAAIYSATREIAS